MTKRLRIIIFAVLVIACAVILAAWIRSYWVYDSWQFGDSLSRYQRIDVGGGAVEYTWAHSGAGQTARTTRSGWLGFKLERGWQIPWGSHHGPGPVESQPYDGPIIWATAVAVPFWAISLPPLAAIALMLRNWLRRRFAARPGHCRNCGYDLRATPERCPECGNVPSQPTGQTAPL